MEHDWVSLLDKSDEVLESLANRAPGLGYTAKGSFDPVWNSARTF